MANDHEHDKARAKVEAKDEWTMDHTFTCMWCELEVVRTKKPTTCPTCGSFDIVPIKSLVKSNGDNGS